MRLQRTLSLASPVRRGRLLDTESIPGLFLIAANLLGLALVGATAQTAGSHTTLGTASVPDLTPAEEQPPTPAANATAAQPHEHAVRTVYPAFHDALEGQTL
ncbi:hypothetical protein AB0C52_24610 [Streptomyces sp. NPDC048717]|uniref:hypothetical protein n=1 Tax=Streptomyces sp. NPDC048717 TaxID=3154928 RepID=UPI0034136CB2